MSIEGETPTGPILSVENVTGAGMTFHAASDASADETGMPLCRVACILEHGYAAEFARVGGSSGDVVPRDCGDVS